MKKETKNIKKSKKNVDEIEEVVLVDEEDEGDEAENHEELDPEILEALNGKKKVKAKPAKAVDYIPELERDDFDFGDE